MTNAELARALRTNIRTLYRWKCEGDAPWFAKVTAEALKNDGKLDRLPDYLQLKEGD